MHIFILIQITLLLLGSLVEYKITVPSEHHTVPTQHTFAHCKLYAQPLNRMWNLGNELPSQHSSAPEQTA
jgi:hypothetical protein